MESNQKSWLAGCGSGCGCASVLFVVTYGLGVLFAWLMWEVADVRHDLFEPPPALIWPIFLGLFVAGILGLITTFVVRSMVKKRAEKNQIQQT